MEKSMDYSLQKEDFYRLIALISSKYRVDTARQEWNQIQEYIWRFYPLLQNLNLQLPHEGI